MELECLEVITEEPTDGGDGIIPRAPPVKRGRPKGKRIDPCLPGDYF